MPQRRLTRQQRERIGQSQERRRQRAVRRAGAAREDGLGGEQPGLVIANFGPALIVEDLQGGLHRCRVRQNLEALACGDRVVWQDAVTGEGVVVALEPRRSLLTRPDYGGRPRPVAANLHQMIMVTAPRPELSESLIDRYLVMVEHIGVGGLLVLNKIDLLAAEERADLEARLAVYRRIGYPLLFASTRTAHGLDALRAYLRERTSILVGQSGVGKSSLIKALLPDREVRIRAVSEVTGLGAHTTSTATLYHLPGGGDLIDSPGVRSFEPTELDVDDLERGFVEFAPYLGRCRFADCSHTVEPGCALREAVERNAIDPRRFASYQQIKSTLAGA